jgi:hypothetical protein
VLKTVHLYVSPALALSFNAPNLPMTITLAGATVTGLVYWNVANQSSYVPATDPIVAGAHVVLWGTNNVSKITTVTDASGSFALTNVPPGLYNYDVLVGGHNFTQEPLTIQPPPAEQENSSVGLAATNVRGIVASPSGTPIAGATVTLSNSSGTIVTNETNATGHYGLSMFAPGNYTIVAAVLGTPTRSEAIPIDLSSAGATVFQNLTAQRTGTASVTVTSNGAPASGVPVRFTPYAIFDNSSRSPIEFLQSATTNGSVAMTGADGVATVALPYGNYSVSALGPVGSTLSTATGSLVASSGVPNPTLTLALAPAVRLSGSVTTSSAPSSALATAVVAYSSSGVPTFTWTVNGSFAFYLARGNYSLYALEGTNSSTSSLFAALSSVSLTGPTSVALTASAAIPVGFPVGSTTATGSLFPAVGASVSFAVGPSGPAVTVLAAPSGVASAYVPSVLPPSATGYCVAASAPGFVAAQKCGIAPSALGSLTSFPLSLVPVNVSLSVLGGVAGTTRLNFTAVSSSAVSRSFLGGPTFSATLMPGSYNVTAWEPTGNSTTVMRSSSTLTLALPVGSGMGSGTLVLVTLKNSTGKLTVPSGGTLTAASVALTSPTFNVTVNGTAYTKGFYVAPGVYTAHVTIAIGSTTYTEVAPVTVTSTRAVTPALTPSSIAVTLTGTLERSANVALATNTTAVLRGSGGSVLDATVVDGRFSVSVPASTNWTVTASASTVETGPAGAYRASWVASAGSVCDSGVNGSACSVTMVPTPQSVWLNGTLTAAGVPGLVSGTVRLLGPSPATTVTTVSASGGTFSALLAPGVYSLYASGGGSSEPLAALLTVPVSLTAPGVVDVALAPAWTATVTVAPPSSPLSGTTNLTITGPSGAVVAFPGLATSSPVMVSLPVGSYVARATSYGVPYGLPSNASATEAVSIVRGNVGATLALTYAYVYKVTAAVSGSPTATVAAPGTARFAFSLRATGNAPVSIHPVGSPSSWSFNYSFTNATLVPGAVSAYPAWVTVNVPAGASALEPTVVIEFELGNGTVVGSFTATVNVVATYGVHVSSAGPPTVGLTTARVPFFVTNTGNTVEKVALSVVDLARLEGLGWTVGFATSTGPLNSSTISLSPFQNTSYDVTLSTTLAVFVAPGSVTVQASVLNQSGAFQSAVELAVPVGSIAAHSPNGSAPVTVTGPVIGTPPTAYPDWLVPLLAFVPALALVVGVIAYRWWRTRRWTRR